MTGAAGHLFMLIFRFPLEELHDLHDGDDAEGQRQGHQVLVPLHAGEVEGGGDEGHLAHQGGGQQAADSGKGHHPVAGAELQDAAPLGPHVETVENFCHGHGDEGHGGAVRAEAARRISHTPDSMKWPMKKAAMVSAEITRP